MAKYPNLQRKDLDAVDAATREYATQLQEMATVQQNPQLRSFVEQHMRHFEFYEIGSWPWWRISGEIAAMHYTIAVLNPQN